MPDVNRTPSPPITVVIKITADGHGELHDEVVYPTAQIGKDRHDIQKTFWNDQIKKRPKTLKLPAKPHAHDPNHQLWIVKKGDTVIWQCDREFMLHVDYNLEPCDSLPGTPRNPFGWEGVQKSKREGTGPHQVTGIVRSAFAADKDQMFYKFTAFVDGLEPLDPDGSTYHGP